LFLLAVANAQNLAGDLATLDFQNILGGPLNSVIRAQAGAAQTTIDFINELAFELDNNGKPTNLRTVDFNYARSVNGTVLKSQITVPFLILMPIPFLEIEEVVIKLTVDLSSVTTFQRSASFGEGWNFRYGGGGVGFQCGVSFQATDSFQGDVKQDFHLFVEVKARQSELPKGMSRVLDWMEKLIATST